MKRTSYTCKCCGQVHDGLPVSYATEAPVQWGGLAPEERKKRGQLGSDQCIIDNEFFYVKGNIRIPIIGESDPFVWTVWVSLSHDSFDRVSHQWEKRGREKEPPYFGWLSTDLPFYPDTMNLKTSVLTQPKGIRFHIELEPTDHPLAVEQRDGITWDRVQEFAEKLLHP
jgi:hypothetical protein